MVGWGFFLAHLGGLRFGEPTSSEYRRTLLPQPHPPPAALSTLGRHSPALGRGTGRWRCRSACGMPDPLRSPGPLLWVQYGAAFPPLRFRRSGRSASCARSPLSARTRASALGICFPKVPAACASRFRAALVLFIPAVSQPIVRVLRWTFTTLFLEGRSQWGSPCESSRCESLCALRAQLASAKNAGGQISLGCRLLRAVASQDCAHVGAQQTAKMKMCAPVAKDKW